jgi:hypothetical protein
MPMDFLRRVEKADLPLTVEEFADVNNVAVLRAAGLVEAEMVEAVEGDPDTPPSDANTGEFEAAMGIVSLAIRMRVNACIPKVSLPLPVAGASSNTQPTGRMFERTDARARCARSIARRF